MPGSKRRKPRRSGQWRCRQCGATWTSVVDPRGGETFCDENCAGDHFCQNNGGYGRARVPGGQLGR